MTLPFTATEFFGVFARYNDAVWPAQVVLVAAAIAGVLLAAGGGTAASRAVSGILAALWAWTGLAYHVGFFASINPAAPAFAAVFVAGAAVFLWQGVVRGRVRFRVRADARGAAGFVLVFFALAVYPAWSLLAGHAYPAMPTFGLPCPVALYTVGMLAFASAPRVVYAAPIAWCVVGLQAAWLLGVLQDLSLAPAAALALYLAARPPAAA